MLLVNLNDSSIHLNLLATHKFKCYNIKVDPCDCALHLPFTLPPCLILGWGKSSMMP